MVPLEATQVNGGSNKLYEKLVFAKFPPHKHIFVVTLFTFIAHVLSVDTCLYMDHFDPKLCMQTWKILNFNSDQ